MGEKLFISIMLGLVINSFTLLQLEHVLPTGHSYPTKSSTKGHENSYFVHNFSFPSADVLFNCFLLYSTHCIEQA